MWSCGGHGAIALLYSFGTLKARVSTEIPPLFISKVPSGEVLGGRFERIYKLQRGKFKQTEDDLASQSTLGSSLSQADDFGITAEDIVKSGNFLPVYPREAIERGWEGTVHLKLKLSDSGRVVQADLVATSGYPILDLAALKASRQWKFEFPKVVKTVIAPVKFTFGS